MLNYEQAQYRSKYIGEDVLFQDLFQEDNVIGVVIGVVRYHDGNWYWININRLRSS